ncbi:hypothetical protein IMG5_063660 [Ichthyophthirius multifiliis]|uniref:Uncharacterized protein n=1 Tax=Ichthyophthirius multifiliis TaxID=5932 RepID=G0QP38_ICHMU|nr:hypothetical protein IMG5_063660 [Ichthyophthirius multifiliis]EGR33025.1 hypothetical protein IMG5_063660 [Ichthyophthirius multifiliis]|eukprot:XP_004037011.1 hypothetical protein IMG5_063660 [Ichthyophthirius multifiliis]
MNNLYIIKVKIHNNQININKQQNLSVKFYQIMILIKEFHVMDLEESQIIQILEHEMFLIVSHQQEIFTNLMRMGYFKQWNYISILYSSYNQVDLHILDLFYKRLKIQQKNVKIKGLKFILYYLYQLMEKYMIWKKLQILQQTVLNCLYQLLLQELDKQILRKCKFQMEIKVNQQIQKDKNLVEILCNLFHLEMQIKILYFWLSKFQKKYLISQLGI